MRIKFWGVRGSIPVPGPGTVRYGGNTTCIEIRTDDNELIILDGGTGIFPLAQTLLAEMPVTANVFVTMAIGIIFRACRFSSRFLSPVTACCSMVPTISFPGAVWNR